MWQTIKAILGLFRLLHRLEVLEEEVVQLKADNATLEARLSAAHLEI